MSDIDRLPDEYWTEYAEETEMVTCPSCKAINITRIHEVCWKCGRKLRDES
jgi:ribosomal protein L37AE/L43A